MAHDTTPDLHIPDESQEALVDLYETAKRGVLLSADEQTDFEERIIAPAVAAELRRLADIADVLPVGFQMLRNRAEELAGGQR